MQGTRMVAVDPAEAARLAAGIAAAVLEEAVSARGRATWGLAGGSTPEALYELLAMPPYLERIPWNHLHVFFGDERCVPPDHPDSNYHMAWEAMLSKVPIPSRHVHRIEVERQEPEGVAQAYAATISRVFALSPEAWPQFDCILLGMGADGHTASLFPGTAALDDDQRLVAANYVPQLQAYRLTLTLPVINHARDVVVLAVGAGKAAALKAVEAGSSPRYPVSLVAPEHGTLTWIVDRAACSDGDWRT